LGSGWTSFSSHNGLYPDSSYFKTPWFKSFSGMWDGMKYEICMWQLVWLYLIDPHQPSYL
jgi:hypothetical protein